MHSNTCQGRKVFQSNSLRHVLSPSSSAILVCRGLQNFAYPELMGGSKWLLPWLHSPAEADPHRVHSPSSVLGLNPKFAIASLLMSISPDWPPSLVLSISKTFPILKASDIVGDIQEQEPSAAGRLLKKMFESSMTSPYLKSLDILLLGNNPICVAVFSHDRRFDSNIEPPILFFILCSCRCQLSRCCSGSLHCHHDRQRTNYPPRPVFAHSHQRI